MGWLKISAFLFISLFQFQCSPTEPTGKAPGSSDSFDAVGTGAYGKVCSTIGSAANTNQTPSNPNKVNPAVPGTNTNPNANPNINVNPANPNVNPGVVGGVDPNANPVNPVNPNANPVNPVNPNANPVNPVNPNATPGAALTTFFGDIKPLIEAKCAPCHTPGGQFGDLTQYDLARNTAQDSLNRMNHVAGVNIMPPGAANKLPPAEIALFQKWINDGTQLGSVALALLDETRAATGAGTPTGAGNQTGTATTDESCKEGPDAISKSILKSLTADKISPIAKGCIDKDQIFDITKQDGNFCLAAEEVNEECTYSEASTMLQAVAGAESALDSFEKEGWQISQCGSMDNKPVLSINTVVELQNVKKVVNRMVRIRELSEMCQSGNKAACDEEEVSGDRTVLHISKPKILSDYAE